MKKISTLKKHHNNKKHTSISLSVAVFFSSMVMQANVQAAEFSNAVFFGDSLTDTGFFRGIGNQPSFTTNPDPVWATILSQRYGLPAATPAQELTPSGVRSLGGNNYAIAGARIATQGDFPDPALAPFISTITQQVDLYLGTNSQLNRQGLYAVWGGANDVSAYLQANISGLLNPATQMATLALVMQEVRGEAINLSAQIKRLQNAGAGTVLIFNLPDLGRTPSGSANPALANILSRATREFNDQLNRGIDRLGGNIVALNSFRLFNEIIANPKRYGFQNVTDPACTTPDASTCTISTLVTADANRTYLFADDQHPTGAGHAILAQYAYSVLQAPGQIGMLAEAPLSTTQTFTQSIDSQLRSIAPKTGELIPYTTYEHGRQSINQEKENTGLNRTADSINVGVNYGITPGLMMGASLGLGNNKANFSANTGGFKFDQAVATAYMQYKLGDWKFHGLGLIGKLTYRDVERRVVLGEAIRSERGDTAGEQYLFRAGARYDLDMQSIMLTPLANVTWQKININGYSEEDIDSTSMNFQSQKRRSIVANIGIEATTKLNLNNCAVSPFIKVTRDFQLNRHERDVRANVIGMAGSFALPAYNSSKNLTRLNLGMQVQANKAINMEIAYNGSFAKGYTDNAMQIGLNMKF